jgi:hypothetical protein
MRPPTESSGSQAAMPELPKKRRNRELERPSAAGEKKYEEA